MQNQQGPQLSGGYLRVGGEGGKRGIRKENRTVRVYGGYEGEQTGCGLKFFVKFLGKHPQTNRRKMSIAKTGKKGAGLYKAVVVGQRSKE